MNTRPILEELWDTLDFRQQGGNIELSKRRTFSSWNRVFKSRNLVPRRYLAILHLGNGHYAVESESRSGIMHSVDISEHGCSCENKQIEAKKLGLAPDYRCKHMKLVERLIGEGISPAPHEHK